MLQKPAITSHDIHPLIQHRWSPRAFEPKSLDEAQMSQLMEAARWAPSSMNAQPWRYLIARRDQSELFEKMLTPLNAKNSKWAKDAGALILAIGHEVSSHAHHDVGLANAMLVIQAEALGLRTHQMGGFDAQQARELFHIPNGFTPITYIAVGYQAEATSLNDPTLQERERSPRARRPQEAFVFEGTFGEPA